MRRHELPPVLPASLPELRTELEKIHGTLARALDEHERLIGGNTTAIEPYRFTISAPSEDDHLTPDEGYRVNRPGFIRGMSCVANTETDFENNILVQLQVPTTVGNTETAVVNSIRKRLTKIRAELTYPQEKSDDTWAVRLAANQLIRVQAKAASGEAWTVPASTDITVVVFYEPDPRKVQG